MRVLVHAAVLTVLISGMTAAPATAEQRETPSVQEKSTTVTLLTGDRVTVARQGQGWNVHVEPAARFGVREGFLQHSGPDGVTVIPMAAAPLVRSGQFDKTLFDVTRLIELGYDDAHTPDIPLLVESRSDQARHSVATFGRVTRNLPAAGMTAVATPKRDATKAFEIAKNHKIWLNGKAFPTLDESVPQVGAPGAWQQGHTGVGATIAVLDTGYDKGHPDLAGIVKGEKDFVDEGVQDIVGHGTHVASTAAGRGTASNGKYTGVAKGANLLIGKVCAQSGCPFDAILDGMQWAADNGAKVVNMSLGSGQSDGTDPIETAVNRISAEKGTLFVIAAGNASSEKVSSPAAADAALAVGSVNKKDVRSPFSSPGPRYKDYAVKPDIAAPGQDIVAARAKGTLGNVAVDELHARISGTSMATPHVAGAAAILAAQHPDWSGRQIKTTLMATAHPVPNATIYQQGTGRLDISRAVAQRVTASTGSLSLGYIKWPDPATVLSKALTYKNSDTAPVTLALSSSDPAFKLSAAEVTVPAGGEATVAVSFDGPQAKPVTYGGLVLAKSGTTEVRTAVGATKEPESYDLTLRTIDRDGRVNGGGLAHVQNLDKPEVSFFPVFPGDTVRVPAGRYAVISNVSTLSVPQASATWVTKPEFQVKADVTAELDARPGVPIGTSIDRADARSTGNASGIVLKVGGVTSSSSTSGSNLYAVPTTGRYDHFLYYDSAAFEQPLIRLTVTRPEQFEPVIDWVPGSPKITNSRALSAVDAARARPEDLAQRDVRGKLAVFTIAAGEEQEFVPRLKALHSAGATAAFFYVTDSAGAALPEPPPLPTLYPLDDQGPRLAKLGTASVQVTGIVTSPYHYELSYPSHGAVPATLTHQARTQDLAEVRATYRAAGPAADVFAAPIANGFVMAAVRGLQIPLPTSRTEYYTPDAVAWQQSSYVARQYVNVGDPKVYRRGPAGTKDTYKAVLGPGGAKVVRSGDTLTATLPLFTDVGLNAGSTAQADKGDTVLYADGKEIGRSGLPGLGQFAVGGPAQYRLTTEATRDNPAWQLSTKVTAEWRFRSAQTAALPSIVLDPKVENNNAAKGGTYAAIAVRPGKGGVADKVEVSTDDGTTWRTAPLVRAHDQWWAIVWNPADGFVSLRAQASYPDGNAVSQTVIRAYRVK